MLAQTMPAMPSIDNDTMIAKMRICRVPLYNLQADFICGINARSSVVSNDRSTERP